MPPSHGALLNNASLLDIAHEAAGVWTRIATAAVDSPPASWGHSVTPLEGHIGVAFGDLGGGGRANTAALWALDFDARPPSFRAIAVQGRSPSPRRQHSAAPLGHSSDQLVIVGGFDGVPLGEAWTCTVRDLLRIESAAPPAWTRLDALEGRYAPLLARAAHTLTPLPPPVSATAARFLRGADDAAYLLFGGLTTGRIAALTRTPGATSWPRQAYADAANADAAENGGSPVALNDLVLLTRGAAKAWAVTRLSSPDDIGCYATTPPLTRTTSRRRRFQWSLQPDRGDGDEQQGWGRRRWDRDDPHPLSEEEASERIAAIAPRHSRPCGRHGHSAHLYSGVLGGGVGDCRGTAGSGYGCLLVYAGADHASSRLSDLWVLPVDPSWARTRDEPAIPTPLGWRAISPDASWATADGQRAPPRALHASVLTGTHLYVIGGESSSSLVAAAAAPLWQLDLPSLRWSAMHASGGLGPRPGAGAAALLASLPAAAGEGEDAAMAPAAILLLGGQESSARGAMPLWMYRLGRQTCFEEGEETPGCRIGHECDGASGSCVCPVSGATPPCEPPPAPPIPTLVVRDGTMTLVAQAWLLVGLSVVGAHAGGWAAARY